MATISAQPVWSLSDIGKMIPNVQKRDNPLRRLWSGDKKGKMGWLLTTRCSQEAEIFLQLYWVNKMINTKFDARSGISQSRLEILSVLFQVDEISQTDLQKKVNIDSAAITRHVKQLEANGMVSRRRKSEDNRIILVCLTNHGREQIESSLEVKEHFMEEVLANVSAEERLVLKNVLSQMQKNLENNKA